MNEALVLNEALILEENFPDRPKWELPAALGARLDIFENGPSYTLHPRRFNEADREAERTLLHLGKTHADIWHRHRSKSLLGQFGSRELYVPPMSHALAQLVLLNRFEMSRLADLCAAVLLAGSIKAAISQAQVRTLIARLGLPLYRLVLERSAQWHPGLPPQHGTNASVLLTLLDTVGWSVMASAIPDDLLAIQARFMLKLPPASPELLPTVFSGPHEALVFISILLQQLDFPWFSYFNAPA